MTTTEVENIISLVASFADRVEAQANLFFETYQGDIENDAVDFYENVQIMHSKWTVKVLQAQNQDDLELATYKTAVFHRLMEKIEATHM